VNRFEICIYELGDHPLNSEEQCRLPEALETEAECLRSLPAMGRTRIGRWMIDSLAVWLPEVTMFPRKGGCLR
jgi:hypothetical protein